MDIELMNEMNAAYCRLETKRSEIFYGAFRKVFEMESGWYNGHYHKNGNGDWERESYPIPVIGIKNLCDIEIQFDKITLSTNLKRDVALNYSFEKFSGYEFEAYGVEDYLADYYHAGQTVEVMKENIRTCKESEIGFSFVFPFETGEKQILEFVKLLQCEGFYY